MRHLGCRAGRRRISAGRVLAQHPAEELTPEEFENKLASVADKENWAPSKFNRYRSLVSLSYRLIKQRVKTPKPFGLHNFGEAPRQIQRSLPLFYCNQLIDKTPVKHIHCRTLSLEVLSSACRF